MNKEKQKFVIIDGNAIIHRAYHAIPPLTTQKGEMVNAVYGFLSMMLRVWKELKPEYLVVTFDMAGKTFRHERFAEYKATRVRADQELYDQIPLVHRAVEAFNIPIFERSGYEADDVIGTIVKDKKLKDLDTYIVTGDKDTLQLVDKNIKVFTLGRGMSDVIIYDEAQVRERFGFGPVQMIDFKALSGDPSDNIPGVAGVGVKTATDLIKQFGNLKNILKEIKSDKREENTEIRKGVWAKLENGAEDAKMSYELATIDCNVPKLNFKLEKTRLKEFKKEDVLKFFQEYEFVSLLKRVPGMEGEAQKNQVGKKTELQGAKQSFKFEIIKTKKEFEVLIDKIFKAREYACKEVLEGEVLTGKLRGLIFIVNNEGFFVDNLEEKLLKKILKNKEITLVGHDLKKLVKVLLNLGYKIDNELFDVMLASYILNPGNRAHDSASVVFKNLGQELVGANGQNSLFGADPKIEAENLWLVYQTRQKLKKELEIQENLGLLEKIEGPLMMVLSQMELNGIAIDMKMLNKMSVEINKNIKNLTKKIYDLAGVEFNIASPMQIREILFEKMEIPAEGIKKGKTGLSTSSDELEKIKSLHPIVEKIMEFRELSKLQNTYIDVLPKLVNKKTGRIHTTFNQAVTATGRLSSSDPNLQNIPIRTELGREIRNAFISGKGNDLIVADYSQIELRIVASLAKDKKMIEIFKKGEDIHTATAAAINNVPLDKVTRDMRRAAKEVNFGVLYGMGAYGLSWRTKIPTWQAKDFIEKYFENFAGVKKYIKENLKFTKENGYCETLFGRRRYLPELKSSNFQMRSGAERMATNHPIQGTAADLMKMAMIELDKKLKEYCEKNNYPERSNVILSGAKELDSSVPQNDSGGTMMILQVHDEIVLEVKKEFSKDVAKIVKETMESVAKLNVPIEVDVNAGKRWGEIH